MPLAPQWRAARTTDLAAIVDIAGQVHPSFPEDPEIFAERLHLYPAGVHILECAGKASGYLIGHPWRSGSAPALNTLLCHIPRDADTFYFHDLALLPMARGTGAARKIVQEMADFVQKPEQGKPEQNTGIRTLSLVAVNQSVAFWQHLGFEVEDRPDLAKTLSNYEEAARFMVRAL